MSRFRLMAFATLVAVPGSAEAMAVRVAWSGIYLAGLVIAGPGILLSLWLFHRAVGAGLALVVLGLTWIIVMPWAVMFLTDAISDGIHGQLYAYSYGQLLLRIWLPGLVLPALSALIAGRLLRGLRSGKASWR